MQKHFTDASFENDVLKADKPVLVDFWAPWCRPCLMMAPVIEELALELDGKAVIGKVNVDEQSQYAQQYGIMSIPTLLVFKNGEVVDTMIGVTDKDDLKECVMKHV